MHGRKWFSLSWPPNHPYLHCVVFGICICKCICRWLILPLLLNHPYLGCVVVCWQDQEVVELVLLKSTLLVQAVKVQKVLSELKTPSGSWIQPVEDPTQRAKQLEIENIELTPFHVTSQQWSWIWVELSIFKLDSPLVGPFVSFLDQVAIILILILWHNKYSILGQVASFL